MKGQIFIITSIMVVLFLLLVRINTKIIEVKEEEFFYENFLNLKKELIKTIDISLLNGESISTNLNDFIDFSTDVYKNKGYQEIVDYSISTIGNTKIVNMNISLKSKDSYLMENLIINRTVYT